MHCELCVSHPPFLLNRTYDVLILLDLTDVRKNCIDRKHIHGHVSEVYIRSEGEIPALFNI
jgi:hypothetical protein